MRNPERGQVWLVDLGYVAKVRPCLVISILKIIEQHVFKDCYFLAKYLLNIFIFTSILKLINATGNWVNT